MLNTFRLMFARVLIRCTVGPRVSVELPGRFPRPATLGDRGSEGISSANDEGASSLHVFRNGNPAFRSGRGQRYAARPRDAHGESTVAKPRSICIVKTAGGDPSEQSPQAA